MLKRKFLFLTLSLLLVFTILTGQIASVAYADNGNHGKKNTEDSKKAAEDREKDASLEQYLKPLLNVKVKDGSITVSNRLVNPNGRKSEVAVSSIKYNITIKPFYRTNSSKTWELGSSTISAFSNLKPKPGRIKELEYEDRLEISTGRWNKTGKAKGAVPAGKYVAQVDWTIKDSKHGSYSMAISKVFVVSEKGQNDPKPSWPQVPSEKPNVYVDMKTTKEDGRLRIDFALINESAQKVTYKFNDGQQYDIVVAKNNAEVYRWSYDKSFIMSTSEINIAADGKYQFPAMYWDYLDNNKNKVSPGYYTVKVEVIPDNKSTLEKNFDLGVYDLEEVYVDKGDMSYDIDLIMQAEVVDRQLKLKLTLQNRINKDVEIWHRSAKPYTITIRDKKGNVVYKSDAGLDFITVLTETELGAGEVKLYAADSLDLLEKDFEPGEYTVEADLNVSYVQSAGGSLITDYKLTADKPIKLTEFDVNKNVAVTIRPKIVDKRLYIPFSLTNVSGQNLRIYFESGIDYSVVIKKNDKVVYENTRNLYGPNETFALTNKEITKIDEAVWDMKSASGDISIQVTVNGNVKELANRTADWQAVQVFTLP